VGAGSATYHLAYQLADKFGVVASNTKTVPELTRRIKMMGCYDRMTSMRPLDIPMLQMMARKEEVEKKFIEIAQDQINEEDAQLIVAGNGFIFPALGFGSRERIQKMLGVPILEGPAIAIQTLEMLINLKLTHSKKTYPSPNKLPT
jgi:allantoin racemase